MAAMGRLIHKIIAKLWHGERRHSQSDADEYYMRQCMSDDDLNKMYREYGDDDINHPTPATWSYHHFNQYSYDAEFHPFDADDMERDILNDYHNRRSPRRYEDDESETSSDEPDESSANAVYSGNTPSDDSSSPGDIPHAKGIKRSTSDPNLIVPHVNIPRPILKATPAKDDIKRFLLKDKLLASRKRERSGGKKNRVESKERDIGTKDKNTGKKEKKDKSKKSRDLWQHKPSKDERQQSRSRKHREKTKTRDNKTGITHPGEIPSINFRSDKFDDICKWLRNTQEALAQTVADQARSDNSASTSSTSGSGTTSASGKSSDSCFVDGPAEKRKPKAKASRPSRLESIDSCFEEIVLSPEDKKISIARCCTAVKRDDIRTVMFQILGGCNINGTSKNGERPLLLAARYGRDEIARILLDHDCDQNARDADGNNALHEAVEKADTTMVQLLLEGNISVNMPNIRGETPLCIATKYDYELITRMIIEAGAHIDSNDNHVQDPFMVAVQNGSDDVARLLMTLHCNVNKTSSDGKTALYHILHGPTRAKPELIQMMLHEGYDATKDKELLSHKDSKLFETIGGTLHRKLLKSCR
ncbi:unnamed protein product [Owenia fusiformis]|uniref:Uncharacterized protein n=1 Tax=Owenia fusiformis TaxID=6347 RepID=A0A8J1Y475_OWEFU|nr:unnamed protein product [Owenia fusiformis]